MITRMALICIALAFVVSGCDSGKAAKKPKMTASDAQPVAEVLIKPKLRDPDSAVFSGIIFHEENADHGPIVCGYVNSRNGFGGMTGPQRFVTGGTVIIEEEVGSANMNIAWKRFC